MNLRKLLATFWPVRSPKPSDQTGWPRVASFTVVATRDDIHPGDLPEPLRFTVDVQTSAEAVLRQAANAGWLPTIYESIVTWSITSDLPLAVVEHDCRVAGPKNVILTMMPFLEERLAKAHWSGNELTLHFHIR